MVPKYLFLLWETEEISFQLLLSVENGILNYFPFNLQ